MNSKISGAKGRGRGWEQPENPPGQLRRPKLAEEDMKVEPQIKSNLSADAKEWYPPNYTPQVMPSYSPASAAYPPRFSVQNRLLQAQDPDNSYNFSQISQSLNEVEKDDLKENILNLINVMCEITFNPGKFDTLCGTLLDSFAPTLNDENYTIHLVNAIVNQSINESNFRYNGARLCSMFDSVSTEDSIFRECLLNHCSAEVSKIRNAEATEDSIRGFAMFLAEIYTQLENTQGRRILELGQSLCTVLSYLLDTEKEVNIKAVCQLLKLSGIALDADCTREMSTIFSRLASHSRLPAVNAVLELRAKRWGLSDADELVSNGSGEEVIGGGFLADGHELTAEERAFLQTNLPSDPANLHDDILDELEDDTEMDPEMREGYLEFLMMSNQIKR